MSVTDRRAVPPEMARARASGGPVRPRPGAEPARRGLTVQRREALLAAVLRAVLVLAVLAAWYAAGDDTRRASFPTPSRVMSSAADLTRSGELLPALFASNVALFWGYLAALVVGIALGAVMGVVPVIGRIARPYIVVLMAVPTIALLPLIQAIFGIDLLARVIVIFVFAFIFLALNTEIGVTSASPQLLEMSRSFGAGRWTRFSTIILPQAVPAVASGARLALGRAIAGMVLAELFLVSDGIGSLLAFYRSRMDSGAVFAIILCLILNGAMIMAVTRVLERRLTGERT